jgi:ATP-dependent protease HslVU (ClpYQ) peptidase subunit
MNRTNWMRKIRVLVVTWALAAVAGTIASAQEAKTFYGEVSDSQCAMNVHSLTRSHQEMLKSKSMGGTATECARFCVQYHGGDFVLASKKDVYRLDDQNQARAFAGTKVKITGEMQSDKQTIHVIKIEQEN